MAGLWSGPRLAGWLVLWLAVKSASIPALRLLVQLCSSRDKEIISKLDMLLKDAAAGVGNASARVDNLRRLLRGWFYCFYATFAGLCLIVEYRSWPRDLLSHNSIFVTIAFEGAVVHWILALMEDYSAGSIMVASHIMMRSAERHEHSNQYWISLVVHHVFTIAAYAYCLSTGTLCGLCVFGLLFEGPVIVMNIREIIICYEEELLHPMTPSMTQAIWTYLPLLWHVFRSGPCLLWPISLIIWRNELATLSLRGLAVYNILGALFSYVNFVLFFQIFPRFKMEDAIRSGIVKLPRSSSQSTTIPMSTKSSNGESKYTPNWAAYLGEEPSSPHMKMLSSVIRSVVINTPTPQLERRYTEYELSLHNTCEDVWVSIDGIVYDVTRFLYSHPGGSESLLQVAGSDATTAFTDVGHSKFAVRSLQDYAIGTLSSLDSGQESSMKLATSAGDDRTQSSKQQLTDPFLGDPNGLYETLKVYVFLGSDPFMLSMISQIPFMICLVRFSKYVVSDKSHSLQFSSSSFMNILSLSFHMAMTFLVIGNVFLVPLQLLKINRGSVATSLLEFRTHISAVVLLMLLFTECVAITVSFSVSRDSHFYRITLFGTSAVELLIRWISGATGRNLTPSMIFRHPLPAFLFLFSSVVLDAFSFKMISPTCGHIFFFSDCNSEEDKRQTFMCLAFVAVVMSRCVFTRCLGEHISVHGRNSYATTQNICMVAVAYGSIIQFYASYFEIPLQSINNMDGSMLLIGVGAIFFGIISLILLTALVAWSTPHFALQARMLFLGALLWWFCPPVSQGRWICFLLALGAVSCLSVEGRNTVKKRAPIWVYAAKSLEDYSRLYLATWIYNLSVRPLIFILSVLSPDGLKYWANNGPVMDLGDDCEYGMAYQINSKKQPEPHVFQLNVGTMQGADDFFTTANATQKMMKGLLDDPEAGDKGFVSDLVVHFTSSSSSSDGFWNKSFREINLNIWNSSAAARDWYASDQTHKELVSRYHGRDMTSFSAMIASLTPAPGRPIQWHNRCSNCYKLSQGPDPLVCDSCGSTMKKMSYF